MQESGRRIPYGRRVPCVMGAPRVSAVIALPEGRYPGPDFFADTADEICRDAQDWVIAPTTETWLEGDRTLVCIDLP